MHCLGQFPPLGVLGRWHPFPVAPMTPANPETETALNEQEAEALANHSTTDISLVDIDHDILVMLEAEDGDRYWTR